MRFATQNRVGVKIPCDQIRQAPVKVVKVTNFNGVTDLPLEQLGVVHYLEVKRNDEIRELSERLEGGTNSKSATDAIDPFIQKTLPTGTPRTCEICGSDLPPSDRKNACRTCSKKCRNELDKREKLFPNICKACGRSFYHHHRERAGCSPECDRTLQLRIGQFRLNPEAISHFDQICKACGGRFRRKKPQDHCSCKCAQKLLAPSKQTTDIELLKQLHAQGLVTAHIAQKMKMHQPNVARWLKKLGLEPNRRTVLLSSGIGLERGLIVNPRNHPHPFGRSAPEYEGDIFYTPGGTGLIALRPFEPKFDRATNPNWDGIGERFVDSLDAGKRCKDLYPCWTCQYLDYPQETQIICRWAPHKD